MVFSMVSIFLPLVALATVGLLWLLVYRFPARVSAPGLRIGLAVAAALMTFIVVGGLSFVAAMFLAGPHADILPESYARFVFLAALVISIVLPVLAALTVARRLRGSTTAKPSDKGRPP